MKKLVNYIIWDPLDSVLAALAAGALLAYAFILIVNAFGCACFK